MVSKKTTLTDFLLPPRGGYQLMTDQSNSRLLCLPRELRGIIYSMIFGSYVLEIQKGHVPESIGLKPTHAEAVDVYYRNLTIESSPYFTTRWARALAHNRLRQVPKIKGIIALSVVPYISPLGTLRKT